MDPACFHCTTLLSVKRMILSKFGQSNILFKIIYVPWNRQRLSYSRQKHFLKNVNDATGGVRTLDLRIYSCTAYNYNALTGQRELLSETSLLFWNFSSYFGKIKRKNWTENFNLSFHNTLLQIRALLFMLILLMHVLCTFL